MDSQNVLKWHIKVFKFTGLWTPIDRSILYAIWSTFCIVMVYLGYPISQLITLFYVNTVTTAVDRLVMTSTIVMAAIKALNVLTKRRTFMKLFHLMTDLDDTITPKEHEAVFKGIFRDSNRLFVLFFVNYIVAWICVDFQSIMSDPERKLYPSTYFFQNEFLNQRPIYVGVMVYQAISNLFLIISAIAVDTYGSSLLHILGGHIDLLHRRLQRLAKNCKKIDEYKHQKEILVELCERYLRIIRFVKGKFT